MDYAMLCQLCKIRNQQFEIMKRYMHFACRSIDVFVEIPETKDLKM